VTEHDRYLGRPERVDPEDAFLCFPFEIEVFTDDPFDHEALVGDVSTVLDALDRLDVRYVTAADFEDELPRGGRSPRGAD
jgi:hypothetical protein